MDPILRAAAKSWPNFRSKFPSVFWFNKMLIADQYSHFCCTSARRSKWPARRGKMRLRQKRRGKRTGGGRVHGGAYIDDWGNKTRGRVRESGKDMYPHGHTSPRSKHREVTGLSTFLQILLLPPRRRYINTCDRCFDLTCRLLISLNYLSVSTYSREPTVTQYVMNMCGIFLLFVLSCTH